MSLFNVFDVAGSGMNAQSTRLNLTASNLANADSVASRPQDAYRAREPVFAAALEAAQGGAASTEVQVRGVVQSNAEIQSTYEPSNPMADAKGYVYHSNVNTVESMVNMISASRSYQNDVEVMNTSKDLLLQTLRLGR